MESLIKRIIYARTELYVITKESPAWFIFKTNMLREYLVFRDFTKKFIHFDIGIKNEIASITYFFTNFRDSFLLNEYFNILIYLFIAFILSSLLIFLSYFMSLQNPEVEKLSTYECGFEPYENARSTHYIPFYIIAILFIIFDLETVYLVPWSISTSRIPVLGYWGMIDFILELGLSFFYVWCSKGLVWKS